MSDTRLERGSAPLDLEGGPVGCAALVSSAQRLEEGPGGVAASAWVVGTWLLLLGGWG